MKLKNTIELHSGLSQKEVRDFLSYSLAKSVHDERKDSKLKSPRLEDGLDWSIANTQYELEYVQRTLDILKRRKAIITIIKMNGWEDWDVSDYTAINIDFDNWNGFIGTEQEYKSFLKNLRKKMNRKQEEEE